MQDSYLLIANHLRDLHHIIDEKIKNAPKNRPTWTVNEGGEIEETYPLLILANLLDKLGGASNNGLENRLADMERIVAMSLGEMKNVE